MANGMITEKEETCWIGDEEWTGSGDAPVAPIKRQIKTTSHRNSLVGDGENRLAGDGGVASPCVGDGENCLAGDGGVASPWLDRSKEIRKTFGGNLPHWHQGDKMQFVTFRLADSMPQAKLKEMHEEKERWLATHPQPWDEATEKEYYEQFVNKIDQWLDAGYGSCLLRDERARAIVETCLRHFDGEQYDLVAYVVMPNHVHVLARIYTDYATSKIVSGWKSVSAHKINKALSLHGELWQKEYFDRIVRNEQHYLHIIHYIEYNYRHGGQGVATPPSPHQ